MDGDSHTPLPGSSLPSGDSASSQDGMGFRAASFRIAGWTVVPQAHELVRPGETARVEPRPMEVLVVLAERAGEAVSREDLMEAVWPGVFVSEHALNRCISQLRKLFDDDPRAPRVIETIPKSGYRLIAPVERVGDGLAAPLNALDMRVTASPVQRPTSAPRRRRMPAVLGGIALLAILALVAVLLRPRTVMPVTQTLTVAPGVESQAAWSPDGTRLVYAHRDEEGASRLYVRTLGADAPVRLTEGPRDFVPVWRGDGSEIAFVRCADNGCAVFGIDPMGGEPRRMLDAVPAVQSIDWSPDGQTLVLSQTDTLGTPMRLMLADVSTGRRQPVFPPHTASDVEPVFSPDGERLLFERRSPSGGDLYSVAVAGGIPERLTHDDAPLAGHTWSSDGRSIVFSSARSGVYALWRVPSDGGDVEPVLGPAVRDPGGPAIAPDGQRMVVGDWHFEINLWRSVDGGAPERLIASTMWDKQPALTPDGSRVAFISNRTGPPELWTANAEPGASGLRRLTDFGGPSVEHPRFAPDGQTLVFQARPDGQADIWLVHVEGGPPRRLTDDPADDLGPRFSQDGQSVYFGSNRGGRWQVWRVAVDGGTPEPVADGIAAEEAPDGSLLVARRDEGGLWKVQDGETQRLSPGPLVGDWPSWAMTEQGVLGLDRSAGRLALVSVETGLGRNLDVELGPLTNNEGTFAASADGRTVVWARIDRVASDLLIVEPFE